METDAQLITMTQQYSQARDGSYIAHLAYERINEQVTAGRPWNKCLDCGTPYPLDQEGAGSEFCSSRCEAETLTYLHNAHQHYLLDEA